MFIPRSLHYTKNHLWLRKIGLYDFYIGITDFAQKEIGKIDVVEIELSSNTIKKEKIWGRIYGTNQTFELRAPCQCIVSVITTIIDKDASKINSDPYNYWLIRVSFDYSTNLFLSSQEYIELIQ